MSDPRYLPPTSRVSDPKSGRPVAATLALILFGLFVLAASYRARIGFELYATGDISGITLVMKLVWIGVLIAILALLAGRRHWARWALIAIAAWEIFELRWGIAEIFGGGYGVEVGVLDVMRWIAPAMLIVGAAVLVFGPAREWFRRRREKPVA